MKTPQEKANDLFMRLFQKQIEITGSADGNLCVEMALVCIDEIIEDELYNCLCTENIRFWNEVIEELKK